MKVSGMLILFFRSCPYIFSHKKKRVHLAQIIKNRNEKYACYPVKTSDCIGTKQPTFCRQSVCSNPPFSCRKAFLFCF